MFCYYQCQVNDKTDLIIFVLCLCVSLCVCLSVSDAGWLQRHQKSLQRFVSASLLLEVVNHLRKSEQLSAEGIDIIQGKGPLQDKVHTLVELLCVRDPQGSALQAYLQNSHPDEYSLITLHGKLLDFGVL